MRLILIHYCSSSFYIPLSLSISCTIEKKKPFCKRPRLLINHCVKRIYWGLCFQDNDILHSYSTIIKMNISVIAICCARGIGQLNNTTYYLSNVHLLFAQNRTKNKNNLYLKTMSKISFEPQN